MTCTDEGSPDDNPLVRLTACLPQDGGQLRVTLDRRPDVTDQTVLQLLYRVLDALMGEPYGPGC